MDRSTRAHHTVGEASPSMRSRVSTMTFHMNPVGSVHNTRTDPANSDHWGRVLSTIMISERFGEDCLAGLAEFSHVEVLFIFDQASERYDYRQRRPPRGRADLPPVGVFADRGPRRPNRVGATICEIISAEGRRVRVRGLDAVNGTPVLDLKPVMLEFLPANVHQPAWVSKLMHDYFRP